MWFTRHPGNHSVRTSKLKTRPTLVLCFLWILAAPAIAGSPCVWPRCKKQAARSAPQLCAEHLRYPDKPEGTRLRDLIWANDVEGIRQLAPIAGPDYMNGGLPPLAHAVYSRNVEAAKALLDAGADGHWRTASGESLVFLAASERRMRMAAFLLAQGIGTREDAVRGAAEAAKISAVEELANELFRNEVEDITGIRPKRSLQENWEDFDKLYSAYAAERNSTPSDPEADHGPRIAIRATITGLGFDDTLKIRSGPGMDNPPVDELKDGAEVTITGEVVMNGETDWYPVRTAKGNGWARGKFLRRR
jgi:Bacterial SH3 domain